MARLVLVGQQGLLWRRVGLVGLVRLVGLVGLVGIPLELELSIMGLQKMIRYAIRQGYAENFFLCMHDKSL